MSVTIVNGIGFGMSGALFGIAEFAAQKNASASIALPKQNGTQGASSAPPLDLTAWPWSPWGLNYANLMPAEIQKYIESCGILSAICNLQSVAAIGKGVQPYILETIDPDGNETLKWIDDSEITLFLKKNKLFKIGSDWAYDRVAYGWKVGTFILSKDRKQINRIKRKDVYDCRLAKKPAEGADADIVPSIFLCSNWDKVGYNPGTKKVSGAWVVEIPALEEDNEVEDLQTRKSGFEFAFISRARRNGRQYYPMPLWWSALEWVKQAIDIPKMKNALANNGMLIKYQINIAEQYYKERIANWDTIKLNDEKRTQACKPLWDMIDNWLSGQQSNAGKSLIGGTYVIPGQNQPNPYIEIKTIEDNVREGKWLPDATAANVEILMACLVNPSFLGAGAVGGQSHGSQSGGSNIRESIAQAIMNTEPYRKEIVDVLEIVSEYNGWNERYNNKLVWRFQNTVLTTLDTGKSTKPETI